MNSKSVYKNNIGTEMTDFPLILTKMKNDNKMCYDFDNKKFQPIKCQFSFCLNQDAVTIERIEKLRLKGCLVELPDNIEQQQQFFKYPALYFRENTDLVLEWLGFTRESFLEERVKRMGGVS